MPRKIISLSLFLPTIASAQATYNLIAPIGSLSGAVNLSDYLNGIFITTIGIAGILAVLMLVICGIQLMGTGSVSGKSEAKQCIWNAIFGLLLAIGSWILLNTINPLLLRNDGNIAITSSPSAAPAGMPADDPTPTQPGWYFGYMNAKGIKKYSRFDTSASCVASKNIQKTNIPGSVLTNAQGVECFEIPKVAYAATETAMRNSLCGNDLCISNSATGIYINNPPCTVSRTTGCTNTVTWPPSVPAILTALHAACNCNITITGGTESYPHKTHGPGKPVADLRHTAALDAVVKSNASTKRASFKRKDGNSNYEWLYNGFWFTDEINPKESHWHICPSGYNATYCRP